MRLRYFALAAASIPVVALLGTAALLRTTDFDSYRPLIARQVEAATGRKLEIAGHLALELSLIPRIEVSNIRFANAPWGTRPEMARIGRAEAEIALLPLLFGELRLKRLIVEDADVLLEDDGRGEANWQLHGDAPDVSDGSGPSFSVSLDDVELRHSRLAYRDGKADRMLAVDIDRLVFKDKAPLLAVDLAARSRDTPIRLSGKIGDLGALVSGAPYPIRLAGTVGAVRAAIKGTIASPLAGTGIDVAADIGAGKLSQLSALVDAPLPAIGPFHIAARLRDKDGGFAAEGIKARLAGSDLAGDLTLRLEKPRPEISGTLAAERIEIPKAALADSHPGPSKEPARIFPAAALPLDWMAAVDLDLGLRIGHLVLGASELDDIKAAVVLDDRQLKIEHFAARLHGGTIRAEAALDARGSRPALQATARARKLDVGRFLKQAGATDLFVGKADIDADAHGAGDSIREIMAGLNGSIDATIVKAAVDTGLLDLIGTDLVQEALPWSKHEPVTHLNCAVARFGIRKGLATARTLLVDTTKITVRGGGTVDLGSEQIDLLLTPRPKERALLSLATPIRIGGTLADPTIGPDRLSLAKGVAGATIGTLINPLGILVPLVSSGTGDENPCAAALTKAKPAAADENANGIGGALKDVGDSLRSLLGN